MDYINQIEVKATKINPQEIVTNLIILNAPNLIQKVRSRWQLGESVFGGAIGEYRSSEYRAYKISLNPKAGGKVDLTLTGALSDGLALRPLGGEKFELFSNDEKYRKIGNKYGFSEFGLSDNEWQELQEELYQFALETMLNRTYE